MHKITDIGNEVQYLTPSFRNASMLAPVYGMNRGHMVPNMLIPHITRANKHRSLLLQYTPMSVASCSQDKFVF